ncbi:MAG: hypothetical protein PVF43_06065 [Candidatus Eiseniibacteriota bacterium]
MADATEQDHGIDPSDERVPETGTGDEGGQAPTDDTPHASIDVPLPDPVDPPLDDGGMTEGVIPTHEMATMEETPGATIPTSTYEMVVVAAREARRLNNRLRRQTDERPEKVTTRAIDRVLAGQVRFAYDDDIAGNL